jgi:hypothetical protein
MFIGQCDREELAATMRTLSAIIVFAFESICLAQTAEPNLGDNFGFDDGPLPCWTCRLAESNVTPPEALGRAFERLDSLNVKMNEAANGRTLDRRTTGLKAVARESLKGP